MQITSPADCESTIKTFFSAFEAAELTDVWQRVVGVVVQPGVEYGSHDVVQYDRELAKPLHTVLERHPQLCPAEPARSRRAYGRRKRRL